MQDIVKEKNTEEENRIKKEERVAKMQQKRKIKAKTVENKKGKIKRNHN